MSTARVLFLALALFVLLENLLFQRGVYGRYLSPDSTTGHMELVLGNEIQRVKSDRNQILTIGDSRMGFFPRYANALHSELGYTFATIASAGTTPRCWPYMLRAADPTRHGYRAIVIALNDFDDNANREDMATRETDLHYLAARLGWLDLPGFVASFPTFELRERAALGIAFKGLTYKTDLQNFIDDPAERLLVVRLNRAGAAGWFAAYRGPDTNVAGFKIDWRKRSFTAPPSVGPDLAGRFQEELFGEIYAAPAARSAYLRRWLGAIVDAYRASGTKIIFLKLPRGPYPRPDLPPPNPNSSIHQLAREADVILDSEDGEDGFGSLERPELFLDPMHFNGPGEQAFSEMLGRRVRALLGPPQ